MPFPGSYSTWTDFRNCMHHVVQDHNRKGTCMDIDQFHMTSHMWYGIDIIDYVRTLVSQASVQH